MNCKTLEHLIALYVEEDLSAPDRLRVETHLQGCRACRDLAEDLRQSQSMFKSLRAGTVNSSDLTGVRVRVLNEVADLEPAPGWVVTMHRLLFAGLRRKTAIAGIVLAVLVSGSVWYSQKRVVGVAKNETPVEVARLEATVVLASPDIGPPPDEVHRVLKRRVLLETPVEVPPETPEEPTIVESAPQEPLVLQIPMKFVTDDPDIIIYWLPADKGD